MKKTIGLVFCLCLGIFGFIGSSYALSGNYQNSCNNCQIVDGKLTCQCQHADGSSSYSTLDNARVCSFIQNIDGQLTCTGTMQVNKLPAGSYQKTCQNCSFDNANLACQCQTRDQSQMYSSALRNVQSCKPGSIQNINGVLRCARTSSWVPAGSYLKTCANCNFDGYYLRCQCRTQDQNWQITKLFHADNCRGISNENGQLVCNQHR